MNDNIVGWFSTEDGTHIPLRNGQTKKTAIEERFNSNHDEYLNDTKMVKKSEVSASDEKKFKTSGHYVVAESSFSDDIPYVENLDIKRNYVNAVGTAPQAPKGAVTSKTKAQAQDGLKWYDNNHTESLKAAEAYKNEMNNFESKGAKKLLHQQAQKLEQNATDAIKNKEWFEKVYSKYL